MTHASLFSGIGGPDLAAEWMGWKNVFHCEINPFGQKILKHYWPNATLYENIITTDFSIHRGTVDVLTGGFPCQPYSLAGLRKGKEDERHLWPEMLRAIREVKPRWVVGENVLGLVDWNDGLVFEEVQADLEAEGYEVQPYILPAASVGAPHRRNRVWFVAYAPSYGSDRTSNEAGGKTEGSNGNETKQSCERSKVRTASNTASSRQPGVRGRSEESDNHENYQTIGSDVFSEVKGSGCERTSTNTNSNERCERRVHATESKETERYTCTCDACTDSSGAWDNFPTQSPVCNGNDGLSSRLDGITFSKWRTESIKAGGNAIVPQVIHQIFKAIQQYEHA